MSRTNKDKPIHARAAWWEPSHWRCENMPGSWRCWHEERACDLPAEPDPSMYDRTAKYGGRHGRCTWEPVWDRHSYGRGCVPKWFTDYVFHNPQRRALRDYGREAVAEHRAGGEVDAVEPDGRARHSAGWEYW